MGETNRQVPHRSDAVGVAQLSGQSFVLRFDRFALGDLTPQRGQCIGEFARALCDAGFQVVDLATNRARRRSNDEPAQSHQQHHHHAGDGQGTRPQAVDLVGRFAFHQLDDPVHRREERRLVSHDLADGLGGSVRVLPCDSAGSINCAAAAHIASKCGWSTFH